MGLLDKTNPNATRQSVIRHALLGAVATPAIILLFSLPKPSSWSMWPVVLPASAIFGAAVAGLMEWQPLDDGPDKPEKEDWGDAFDA
jgi:hypothetical protein